MPAQQALIRELADAINRRAKIDVTRYFTPDFRLDDPGSAALRFGHDGAATMIEAVLGIAPDVRLNVLDAFESGDRVAVRWDVTWSKDGAPSAAAWIAIYRFADGRIAEDWGVSARAPWR